MDSNLFFFVNVCRRLVCAVYFVIVPIGYTLLLSRMNFFKLCSIHISACHSNKWAYAAATEFKRTESLSKCIPNIIQSEKVNKVAVLFERS